MLTRKKSERIDLHTGFTLVELLLVITIIGLLSGIIIAGLNSARARAADSKIKSQLKQVATQAQLAYETAGGCFVGAGSVCPGSAFPAGTCSPTAGTIFSDSKIFSIVVSSGDAYDDQDENSTWCSQTVAGGAWAVAVPLKTGGDDTDAVPDAWCVDSAGRSQPFKYDLGNTIADAIASNACVTL